METVTQRFQEQAQFFTTIKRKKINGAELSSFCFTVSMSVSRFGQFSESHLTPVFLINRPKHCLDLQKTSNLALCLQPPVKTGVFCFFSGPSHVFCK